MRKLTTPGDSIPTGCGSALEEAWAWTKDADEVAPTPEEGRKEWMEEIQAGLLQTYSDGTVLGEKERRRAAHGWVVSGQDVKRYTQVARGGGVVTAPWRKLDSTRAEAEGVLDCMRKMRPAWRPGLKVLHSLDNRGCVTTFSKITRMTPRGWTKLHHKDVWSLIEKEQRWWGRAFAVRWQKGHAERTQPNRAEWTKDQVGNSASDVAADEALEEAAPGRPQATPAGPHLCIAGEEVTGDMRKEVLDHLMQVRMLDYLGGKPGYDRVDWDIMDDVAAAESVKGRSIARRVAVAKMVAGWMATEEVKHKRYKEAGDPDTVTCACCGEAVTEWGNWHAIARCTDPDMVKARRRWIREVRGTAEQTKCPELGHLVRVATALDPQGRLGPEGRKDAGEQCIGEEWEVESIVGERGSGEDTEYRVRWAGWDRDADSWEPADSARYFKALQLKQP